MTEMNNPTIGKPINAICEDPVKAIIRLIIVMIVARINNFPLSINFNSNKPKRQPTVNMAQKKDTVSAQAIGGSRA